MYQLINLILILHTYTARIRQWYGELKVQQIQTSEEKHLLYVNCITTADIYK